MLVCQCRSCTFCFSRILVEFQWNGSVGIHVYLQYRKSWICVIVCVRVCMSVCTHTSELLECLMGVHYILVSSASLLWVWNTAALAPRTPAESDPKDHPYSLIYASLPPLPSLSPSAWPPASIQMSITSSLSLWTLFCTVCFSPRACLAVTSQHSSEAL